MNQTLRVLGIDTSLRSTGIGVVEARGNTLSATEYNRIRIPAGTPLSQTLRTLGERLADTIEQTQPQAAAIEGIFYCRNVKTAMALGEARGVAIATCAARGLRVYEYAPRKIKQAVVGSGAADKSQVQNMVARILSLSSIPLEDEADALALAICHMHNRSQHEALMPKEI